MAEALDRVVGSGAADPVRGRWVRRWSVVNWGILSVVGIASAVDAFGAWFLDWSSPLPPVWLLLFAVALPFVAAPPWGRQWGASLVPAVAGFWLVPAAAVAGAGSVVYLGLERAARAAGLRERAGRVTARVPRGRPGP